MKQQLIQTEKSTILIVDLPEGTKSLLDIEIVINQSVIRYGKQLRIPDGHYKSFPNYTYVDLPPGQWQILGPTWQPSDEFLELLLPDIFHKRRFTHYIDILKANQVYKENPFKDGKPSDLNHDVWYSKEDWQKAQSRTMPNSITLIKRS